MKHLQTSGDIRREILQWLGRFARCVRARDFASARTLFDPGVVSFGTQTRLAHNRQSLERTQWRILWPITRNFRFHPANLNLMISTDGQLVCAITTWQSVGLISQRKPYPRTGRVTLLLKRKAPAAAWRAFHSHFSLDPVDQRVAFQRFKRRANASAS